MATDSKHLPQSSTNAIEDSYWLVGLIFVTLKLSEYLFSEHKETHKNINQTFWEYQKNLDIFGPTK